MKRVIALLVFSSLFLMACPPLPHHMAYKKMEYKALGRAGSEYIVLDRSELKYVLNHQDTITKRLKNKHVKELYQFLKDLDISTLEKLEVPSKKHLFDGALAARLSIYQFSNREHTTPTFDHNNPPKELKGLVEYIRGFIEK